MRFHRWVLAATTAGALVVGGGLVMAQSAPNGAAGGFLATVAANLHISSTALEQAIEQADIQHVQAAVAAGHISAAVAQKRSAAIQAGHYSWLGHPTRRPIGALITLSGLIHTTATYTGLTPAQVRAELASGKTLTAVVSGVPGKTVQGLDAALTAALTTRLNARVTAGHLTSAREQQVLAAFGKRLPAMMTRVWHVPAKGQVQRALGPVLKVTASYTGLTPARVRVDLASGKTLTAVVSGISGKTVQGLESTLTAALTTRLNAAVAAGHLTAAREQQDLAVFAKRLPTLMTRVWHLPAKGGVRRAVSGTLKVASTYTGLSTMQIRTDLRGGETLAQVVTGVSGKTTQGFEAALTAALTTRLNAAVQAGHMTAARQQQLLAAFGKRLPGLLARSWGKAGK